MGRERGREGGWVGREGGRKAGGGGREGGRVEVGIRKRDTRREGGGRRGSKRREGQKLSENRQASPSLPIIPDLDIIPPSPCPAGGPAGGPVVVSWKAAEDTTHQHTPTQKQCKEQPTNSTANRYNTTSLCHTHTHSTGEDLRL